MWHCEPRRRRLDAKPQEWKVGAIVSVGFMRDLKVTGVAAVDSAGRPRSWLLERSGKVYEFIPHEGIWGVSS